MLIFLGVSQVLYWLFCNVKVIRKSLVKLEMFYLTALEYLQICFNVFHHLNGKSY